MHSVSVRLDDSQFKKVEDMARESHKSKAEILREAIDTKIEYEAYKRGAIDEGIDSAMNEPRMSHAEAKAYFKAKRNAD